MPVKLDRGVFLTCWRAENVDADFRDGFYRIPFNGLKHKFPVCRKGGLSDVSVVIPE